ncbi:MAG: acyl carrier protein [Clostridiales bacterium]|nr:acyl carrier protein [Clostridiales bacterium]
MVFEKVKILLAEQFSVNPESITLDSDLVKDLGADSLDLVQLLITMEKEFGMVFDDDEIQNIATVEDVVNFIEG